MTDVHLVLLLLKVYISSDEFEFMLHEILYADINKIFYRFLANTRSPKINVEIVQ